MCSCALVWVALLAGGLLVHVRDGQTYLKARAEAVEAAAAARAKAATPTPHAGGLAANAGAEDFDEDADEDEDKDEFDAADPDNGSADGAGTMAGAQTGATGAGEAVDVLIRLCTS